jgi:8-oxo-dGTP diphosphatase
MFNLDYDRILLMHKCKPDWQAGKLNGIGGKIEAGESPIDAMRRECYEETTVTYLTWTPVIDMYNDDWVVFCFRIAVGLNDMHHIVGKTVAMEEPCQIYEVDHLPCTVLPNIPWLLQIHKDLDLDYKIRSSDGRPSLAHHNGGEEG